MKKTYAVRFEHLPLWLRENDGRYVSRILPLYERGIDDEEPELLFISRQGDGTIIALGAKSGVLFPQPGDILVSREGHARIASEPETDFVFPQRSP